MKPSPPLQHTGCPERTRLSELLGDNLPIEDRTGLQDHIERCASCQETLEVLASGGDTWDGLARRLEALGPKTAAAGWSLTGTGPALEQVLANLHALKRQPVPSVCGLEGPLSKEPSLDFLAPSDTPGSLGRLGIYEVQGVIGRGGMGIVLKALDPTLQRVVAVKVLAPHLANRTVARQRFLREAQLSAAITHENVVPLHAVVEGEGLPFLVMQYVEGISLQQRLDVGSVFAVPDVVRIGLQVARGLAAAHARGVIHRDIKPGNILLEENTRAVKITDFGLARAVDDTGFTESGLTLGTPAFMSPEQAQGFPLDARSDLFSLGSVLYALCTGRPPFSGERPLAVVRRVCDEKPAPVRSLNAEVPGWLAGLLERLHARNPEERPASATEVAAYLERGLAHLEQPERVPSPDAVGAPPRRRGRWLLAAGLLLIAGVGVSEATGFTHGFAQLGTVLRLRTPDGILVVEVDDPQVKVQIDKEDLVITGAGAKEFRFKPGTYLLTASKDGREVRNEVITLQQNGKTTVRISLEAAVAKGPAKTQPARENPLVRTTPVESPSASGPPQTPPGAKTQPLRLLVGHKGPVHSIVVTPDGRYAYSATGWPKGDGTIRQWDLMTGKQVRILASKLGDVSRLALSPDGQRLLAGSGDGLARIWDLTTGKELLRFEDHFSAVNCVVWSPDGKLVASAGEDKSVRLWDPATGKQLAVCRGHTKVIPALAFSPDGKSVLSGSRDETMRLWDAANGEEIRVYKLQHGWIQAVAFSKDGKRVLTADRVATLWDLHTGEELRRYKGAQYGLLDAVLSPDNKYALTCGYDYWVRLYDTATGQQRQALLDQKEFLWTVAFSPDGRFFLSGGGGRGTSADGNFTPGTDFAIRLWELNAVLAAPPPPP